MLPMHIMWMLIFGIILGLSFITQKLPILRPISFCIALPFLLTGTFLNALNSGVSSSPSDLLAVIEKDDLLETFPYTYSLFNILRSNELD